MGCNLGFASYFLSLSIFQASDSQQVLNQLVFRWPISSRKKKKNGDLFLSQQSHEFFLLSDFVLYFFRSALPGRHSAGDWYMNKSSQACPKSLFPRRQNRWSGSCHAQALEVTGGWVMWLGHCVCLQGPKLHLYLSLWIQRRNNLMGKKEGVILFEITCKRWVVGCPKGKYVSP